MISNLTFTISHGVNEGLIISPSELRDLYFYGINIVAKGAGVLKDETFISTIKFAQAEVENLLGIKLFKTFLSEDKSYYLDDYKNWTFIKTSYPVMSPYALEGKIGSQKQINFPKEWLSSKMSSSEDYHRRINLVPNQNGDASAIGIIYRGGLPYWGLTSYDNIPQYWTVQYMTGFNKIPQDLVAFISKLATINIFHIGGDLILGAGIASFSLGIDGLSQSISTTSSATNAGYGSRILGYIEDMKRSLPYLVSKYKGINLMTV